MSSFAGFTFRDGKRVPIEFDSLDEKLYCEIEELCDQKLWEEASEKLDERIEKCGYMSETSYRKIMVGLATKEGAGEKEFQGALKAIKMEIYKDDGSECECILQELERLLSNRVHQIVKVKPSEEEDEDSGYTEDYDNTEVLQLLQAADIWFIYPNIVNEELFCGLTDYSDNAYDQLHCIIDALAKQKQYKTAYNLAKRASELRFGPNDSFAFIYLGFQAECAELFGDPKLARKHYRELKQTSDEEESYDGFVDACQEGTLDERIKRLG